MGFCFLCEFPPEVLFQFIYFFSLSLVGVAEEPLTLPTNPRALFTKEASLRKSLNCILLRFRFVGRFLRNRGIDQDGKEGIFFLSYRFWLGCFVFRFVFFSVLLFSNVFEYARSSVKVREDDFTNMGF